MNSPRAGAVAVRLTRLKQELAPLKLQKKCELVQAHDYGSYFILNPRYDLRTDADAFTELMRRLSVLTVDDPEGLDRCAEALELFRAPFLALAPPEPWLDRLRGAYSALFRRLVFTTLERMEVLGDTRVLPLLTSRVLSVLPEDAEVRAALTAFLAKHETPARLIGFLARLAEACPPGAPEDPEDALPPGNTVYARLFGRFEIENANGRNRENVEKTSVAWLALKYMLLHPERAVTAEELSQTVWQGDDTALTPGNLIARLGRTRALLARLGLEKPNQLLLSEGGTFRFNSAYDLRTDGARFLELMERRRRTPLDDPEGLELCAEGLRLFRGPLLQFCPSAPWVDAARAEYLAEFHALAADTFERMRVLNDLSALSLLSDRTTLLMPEAEGFHKALLAFMAEANRLDELGRHVAGLALVEDRAPAQICAPGAAQAGPEGRRQRESLVMLDRPARPAWLKQYEQSFSQWMETAQHSEVW